MRKKDYELIAECLKDIRDNAQGISDQTYNIICEKLSYGFEARGYKFDKQKFLTACGIEHVHNFNGIVEYKDGSVVVCKDCGEARD